MNVDRILALADLIEKQPHVDYRKKNGFSMDVYFHKCGTPSCIAGWASAMAVNEFGEDAHEKVKDSYNGALFNWVDEFPRSYLGLTWDQQDKLFAPKIEDDWSTITPSQAASTLRHLAKTGEVNWEVGQ